MTADTFAWTLSEMVTRFRSHVGVTNTGSLSDTEVHKWLNDYYQNNFPEEANVDLLQGWFTQATAPTDSGVYSLSQSVLRLIEPVTWRRGNVETEIPLIMNRTEFFETYPDTEDFISAPTLAIGTSDTKAVKTAAFDYDIQGYSYSKASSETSFSGLSTVPQNKYGAFSLTIDANGTITINEATANSTGYATPQKAIEGLADASLDEAFLGYVVVISTDSGGFVPGTTALDDSALTVTYTDGWPGNRGMPEAVCIFGGSLYVRPRCDDIYQIRARKVLRPDALDGDSDVPLDIKWGSCIVCGAAILYCKIGLKDEDRAKELLPVLNYLLNQIRTKDVLQVTRSPIQRSF